MGYYVIALLKWQLCDTIKKDTVEREFIEVGHEEVDDGC